jgi:hypothetical protein
MSTRPERILGDKHKQVHQAIQGMLEDGELAICWVLTIDVAGPDGDRYLAHRGGGGIDGEDAPMSWTALGMLRAAARIAEDQVIESTADTEDDDEEDDSA